MPRRRKGRRIDGILLLDKPPGFTSNGALQQARRSLEARKGGHTGTLDPFATGLLPLCFGQATRFATGLIEAPKEYLAVARVGVATTTGDPEGEICEAAAVAVPGRAALEHILAEFRGDSEQVPPMYSALKQDGRRLHELAREGRTVDRPPRRVRIESLELLSHDADTFTIRLRCSAGTYVRVLVSDIAARFGAPAHTASLRRLAVGPFCLDDAITLETFRDLDPQGRRQQLLPVDAALASLGEVELDLSEADRFVHGQPATPGAPGGSPDEIVRVYGPGREFLGVAALDLRGCAVPRRVVDRSAEDGLQGRGPVVTGAAKG